MISLFNKAEHKHHNMLAGKRICIERNPLISFVSESEQVYYTFKTPSLTILRSNFCKEVRSGFCL